jgi:MEMO1 family protein
MGCQIALTKSYAARVYFAMKEIAEVRPSPIAGTWYSGSADQLRQEVDHYLNEARLRLPDLIGEVVAVIAPHAGHRYSGQTAGYAFAAMQGQTRDIAVVISPMHAPYPAEILTSAHRAYGTPLGPVWIDRHAVAELDEQLLHDGLSLVPVANDTEHSLEIELPFLQRALKGAFQLLPLMIRSYSPDHARRLGLALAHILRGRNAVLVASTDLSHFYPEAHARSLDNEMLLRMGNFDPDALFAAEQTGKGFACGVAAVGAVLWAARELGANKVEVLHHSTSGDETGDRESVVGYGAAVVLKQS